MNHRRACPHRARRHVISIASGNRRAIKPRRRVVSERPEALGHPNGLRRRRLCNVGIYRGKRGDAHQAAALSIRHMRRLRRTNVIFQRNRFRIRIRGRSRMSPSAGMMVGMSALMGMHATIVMDMDHPGHMIVGQAMRRRLTARQGEGQRRRQHAKQIGQGNEPPRPPPLRSCKSSQHQCVNASDPCFRDSQIIEANSGAAKSVTRCSSVSTRDERPHRERVDSRDFPLRPGSYL